MRSFVFQGLNSFGLLAHNPKVGGSNPPPATLTLKAGEVAERPKAAPC